MKALKLCNDELKVQKKNDLIAFMILFFFLF